MVSLPGLAWPTSPGKDGPPLWVLESGTDSYPLEGAFRLKGDAFQFRSGGKSRTLLREDVRSLAERHTSAGDLLHVPVRKFPKRKNVFLPYSAYPESLSVSFEVPNDAHVNVVPFSTRNGMAVENTFRLGIQSHFVKLMKPVYEKFGTPDPVAWNGTMPPRVGTYLQVMIHFDRKHERCTMYLDRQLVAQWFVRPTESGHPGAKVGLTVRANREDSEIRNLRVSTHRQKENLPVSLGFSSTHDVLLLKNGDQLKVEVLSLTQENVTVTLPAGQDVKIPLERVRRIHFQFHSGSEGLNPVESQGGL